MNGTTTAPKLGQQAWRIAANERGIDNPHDLEACCDGALDYHYEDYELPHAAYEVAHYHH